MRNPFFLILTLGVLACAARSLAETANEQTSEGIQVGVDSLHTMPVDDVVELTLQEATKEDKSKDDNLLAVPEPQTLVMLGLAGTLYLLWRRKW